MKAVIRSGKVHVLALAALGFVLGALSATPERAEARGGSDGGGSVCRRCGPWADSPSGPKTESCMPAPGQFGGYDCWLWKTLGRINCMEIGECSPFTKSGF